MAIKHQAGPAPDPTTTKQILTGYRRLVAAVIRNAISEAKNRDPELSQEARDWLRSDGIEWLTWLGIRQPEIGVERLLDPPGKLVISIYLR